MGVRKLHLNIKMKLLAGVLASWVSAQYSFYDYEQTYYASGKSQVAQSEGDSPEVASVARTLGNGRICWSCLEETYTACLSGTAVRGDAKRHGAAYCQGEDYFCYISERRIIRHNENEWNYENGNPWQDDTTSIDHAELINGHEMLILRPSFACRWAASSRFLASDNSGRTTKSRWARPSTKEPSTPLMTPLSQLEARLRSEVVSADITMPGKIMLPELTWSTTSGVNSLG